MYCGSCLVHNSSTPMYHTIARTMDVSLAKDRSGRWHSGICLVSRNGSCGFESQPITPKEGSLVLPEGEKLEVMMPFGG